MRKKKVKYPFPGVAKLWMFAFHFSVALGDVLTAAPAPAKIKPWEGQENSGRGAARSGSRCLGASPPKAGQGMGMELR